MAIQVEALADFVVHRSYEELSDQTRTQRKVRILNAMGCAIGAPSNWKGFAYPNAAFASIPPAAFPAKHGITEPPEVFEGKKGFRDAISGQFKIDWSQEDLERMTRAIVKSSTRRSTLNPSSRESWS